MGYLKNMDFNYKDVKILNIGAILCYMFMIAAITSCNKFNIKPPVNSLKESNFSIENTQLVVVYEEDSLWGIDKSSSIIDSLSLERSIKEAKKKPAYYSNPGGLEGLIGTIIGTQIVREAEASADSLIHTISNLGEVELDNGSMSKAILEDIFDKEKLSIYASSIDIVSTIADKYNKEFYVYIQPRFYFSSSYDSLRVNLVVEVLNKNEETVFRNLYIYSSKPVVCDKDMCNEYWVGNKLLQFKKTAKQSIAYLLHLVRNDLTSDDTSLVPTNHVSIRYQDSMGSHYIRGEVVDKKSDRILVRTLRGYLKSIYVDKYL